MTYVALGDSWPEGAHCGGCETFVGRLAAGLEQETGRQIVLKDITGSAQPYFDSRGGGSESLLAALRNDSQTRAAVAGADIIVIATGPNEIERALRPAQAGSCGGRDDLQCVRALGRFWLRSFDAILDEIDDLRAGKPTAIRLVNAANPFLSDPAMSEGLGVDFPQTGGRLMFGLLRDALCDNAEEHGAICIDVLPILNGPNLDRPVDENSDASFQAIADALLAKKLPELTSDSG